MAAKLKQNYYYSPWNNPPGLDYKFCKADVPFPYILTTEGGHVMPVDTSFPKWGWKDAPTPEGVQMLSTVVDFIGLVAPKVLASLDYVSPSVVYGGLLPLTVPLWLGKALVEEYLMAFTVGKPKAGAIKVWIPLCVSAAECVDEIYNPKTLV